MAHAATVLQCAPNSTRADGAVSLEATYCLGLCAIGPSALLDGRLKARLGAPQVDALAATIHSEEASR